MSSAFFSLYLLRMYLYMKNFLIAFGACVLTFLGVYSCSNDNENHLLRRLDETLEMKETYHGYFRNRIAVLRDLMSEQNDPEQIYNIRKRMALAYKTHNFDSTLSCLLANRELAVYMGDCRKKAETDFMLVEAYAMAGYHVEAGDILGTYKPQNVPSDMLNAYYDAAHCFFGETMAYATSDDIYAEKGARRDSLRNVLLGVAEEGTLEWYDLKREEAESVQDMLKAREYAMRMMECTEINTPEYARSAYFYANTFDGPEREEWLIRSAIADCMCATNDYASLNEISRILFERGDIERAFRYAADHCMADALAYNGRLRAWQISKFFPEIERAYHEKHTRQP